jgi:hypothetical protein
VRERVIPRTFGLLLLVVIGAAFIAAQLWPSLKNQIGGVLFAFVFVAVGVVALIWPREVTRRLGEGRLRRMMPRFLASLGRK